MSRRRIAMTRSRSRAAEDVDEARQRPNVGKRTYCACPTPQTVDAAGHGSCRLSFRDSSLDAAMSEDLEDVSGPDLAQGVDLAALADGVPLLGHAQGEPTLLVRRGSELFAIGAVCTHYGGPLAEGLVVDDTVRCPWHHACFSLRTGAALRAPAPNPVTCRHVEQREGKAFVG